MIGEHEESHFTLETSVKECLNTALARLVVQMEEILARHRKEQKELQAKITSKKKNASKKTRKGVNDECDRLEYDLKQAQQAEIEALDNTSPEEARLNGSLSDPTAALTEEIKDMQLNSESYSNGSNPNTTPSETSHTTQTSSKKPNRQKARMARKAAEQEAAIAAAEQEAASMPDQRDRELSAMKQQLQQRNLVETLIRPDGHCLYSACALSLSQRQELDYRALRHRTAEYISTHADEFAVFLDEPLDSYTAKIRDTAEWGGHLELSAIARAYRVRINVLRSSGRVDVVESGTEGSGGGDDTTDAVREVWLAYYEHSFGLGEHYNALRKQEGDLRA